ncbi:calbindin-32, putative [Ixodes scapularis]|uniref:Calbindin-32, putative n=1 Tax=Ixodes scapularis TaxID=6945 RepID=B7PAY8_IXOSC|nr:calbindin-32, putative [Ixodes scapularis]|eukprot:XP_002407477.1 calbindin-32, putative [Ixodes scapularis]
MPEMPPPLDAVQPREGEVVSESMLEELKECFMEAYDDNKDGKIEIRESDSEHEGGSRACVVGE